MYHVVQRTYHRRQMLEVRTIRPTSAQKKFFTFNPGSTIYTLTFCTLGLRLRIHETADSATLSVFRRMSTNWIAWLRALATPWKKLISCVINTGLWGSARVSTPRMPITRRSWSLRGRAMNEPSPPWKSYIMNNRHYDRKRSQFFQAPWEKWRDIGCSLRRKVSVRRNFSTSRLRANWSEIKKWTKKRLRQCFYSRSGTFATQAISVSKLYTSELIPLRCVSSWLQGKK